MTRFIVILFILTSFLSCKNNKKENTTTPQPTENIAETKTADSITLIKALYFNYPFADSKLYKWTDLEKSIPDFAKGKKEGILDAEINNPDALNKIFTLIKDSKTATSNNPINTRIAITIYYNNGTKDTMVIGDSNTNTIFINETQLESNNRLLYLIKNNMGYYSWMLGTDMSDLKELYDNSYIKEPFIRDKYYKLWQNYNP